MNIETKFTWIIATCFSLGLASSGYISYQMETQRKEKEVLQEANTLMEAAQAVRKYTVEHVKPLLSDKMDTDFQEILIPSFAAQNVLQRVTANSPEYSYRESSLNPTNVRSRATDWEVSLIRAFEADPKLNELSGENGTGMDKFFYIAHPIRIESPACLRCHSTLEAAPPSMVKKYGTGGFGWKIGDVIGLQTVYVKIATTELRARNGVLATLGSLTSVFLLTTAILLLLLRRYVVQPLATLTSIAHASSLGQQPPSTNLLTDGQINQLHKAIVRLQLSVTQTLKLLEQKRVPNTKSNDESAS